MEENEQNLTMDPTQACPPATMEINVAVPRETLVSGELSKTIEVVGSRRPEIDTSAPFESVKEAVDRFGGSAVWKSQLKELFLPFKQPYVEELKVRIVEEQAAKLEKDLIARERETLDVLQELERTKRIVDDLKLRLQKDSSEVDTLIKANTEMPSLNSFNADSILGKLNQEKFNVSKLESKLTNIRASIKSISSKIEGGKTSDVRRALPENEAFMNSNSSTSVILPLEDYVTLTRKAQEADEFSRKRIEEVMLELERAKQSKLELLVKLEEAAAEVKTSREVLEDTLNRLESANIAKLAVEEALRRWRFEHGQKKNLADDVLKDGFNKHALSIGEILSRKLMGHEENECEIGTQVLSNELDMVSLGQLLNRRPGGSACKQHSSKRKKLSFAGLSHLLKNEGKKNKKRRQVEVNDG